MDNLLRRIRSSIIFVLLSVVIGFVSSGIWVGSLLVIGYGLALIFNGNTDSLLNYAFMVWVIFGIFQSIIIGFYIWLQS